MMPSPKTEPTQEAIFAFLDELRATGSVNMYAAAPYIQAAFGLPRPRAREILQTWMRSFDARHAQIPTEKDAQTPTEKA